MSYDLASMSVNELEDEVCGLAARMAAVTCSFLLVVGEFDRRRGWEPWECRDMAAWLSWKCGISPVTAREQVRVATALDTFMTVREQFATGRLSYSQVRAITRVATQATEMQLVEMAAYMTAAQLETALRGYRRASQAGDDLAADRLRRKDLTYGWDDDGCLVGRFRLPPEEGAVLAAAIDAATTFEDADEADKEGAWNPPGAARADALVQVIAAGAQAAKSTEGDDRYLVTIVVDERAFKKCGDEPTEGPNVCQVSDGPGLSSETVRRITCEAATVQITESSEGTVIDVGRRSRRPNRPLERALRHRDRHCQFPGCNRRAHLHSHHVRHWIGGGYTNLDNMVRLCHWHHRRLHEGGFTMQRLSNGTLRFFNRYGIEVRAVPKVAKMGPLDSAESPALVPYRSQWDGSRPDYPMIMDTLLQSDGLLVPEAS